MELALARIEMLYRKKDDIHWEMFKNDCMEKEKEQIIETSRNSYIAGYLDNQCKVDESMNFPEEYYSQAYNQEEVSPQNTPAICNYSGLPSVEHYSSREITIEDIHKIHKEMMDKEEGLYDRTVK